MAQGRPAVQPTMRSRTQIKREQRNRRGFAAFVADRPEPVDLIERFLLRLDWFAHRVAGRS